MRSDRAVFCMDVHVAFIFLRQCTGIIDRVGLAIEILGCATGPGLPHTPAACGARHDMSGIFRHLATRRVSSHTSLFLRPRQFEVCLAALQAVFKYVGGDPSARRAHQAAAPAAGGGVPPPARRRVPPTSRRRAEQGPWPPAAPRRLPWRRRCPRRSAGSACPTA